MNGTIGQSCAGVHFHQFFFVYREKGVTLAFLEGEFLLGRTGIVGLPK
jgi:hypothetical protein